MKRKIVLIASLAAGLLAALLTRAYISAKEGEFARMKARFQKEYGEMAALCFNRDMPSGTIVTRADIAECTTVAKGNDDVLVSKDMMDIIGAKTVGAHRRGIPIRRTYIEGAEERRNGLSSMLPKDKHLRAMSINVTGAASVSGMIRPGDSVDVIGTFDFPNDEGKLRRGDPVTCTILQKVLVLATGSDTSRSAAKSAGMGADARAGGYSLVTLAVTPREAEMLAFAEQVKGRLVLTLRRYDDLVTEETLPTVDFSKIRDEIEDLNKLRNQKDRRK